MTSINERLQDILTTIQSTKATHQCQQQVCLLAVSKGQSEFAIRETFAAGQKMFGENYLQEALDKQSKLSDLVIEWHFIGPIQSNKTQLIAQHFTWVHSIDRLKVAQRLNDARPEHLGSLQVCLQVNISNEESKSGVKADELEALAIAISALPRLKFRGLMAIPEESDDEQKQLAQFKQLRECYDTLLKKGFALDTLSMGMSNDYEQAIEQGATIVRIGSALFGARELKST